MSERLSEISFFGGEKSEEQKKSARQKMFSEYNVSFDKNFIHCYFSEDLNVLNLMNKTIIDKRRKQNQELHIHV